MTRRRVVVSVVMIVAALLAGRAVSVLYADLSWYESLGARSLWWERTLDAASVQTTGFLVAALFSLVNFAAARTSLTRLMRRRRLANVEFGEAVPPEQIRVAALLLSIVVGLGLTRLLPSWKTVALARLGVS